MNRRQKSPPPRIKTPAYRQAFERLDAALEKNTLSDNYEKIRLMRIALFGDVDKLQASGKLVIPK
jgi:hypothetical protein